MKSFLSGSWPVVFISLIYSGEADAQTTHHSGSPSLSVLLDSGVKANKADSNDSGSDEEVDDLLLREESKQREQP